MAPLNPKSAYILIVEDDKTSAYIIKTTLTKAGYTNIDVAVNGKQAIDKAQKRVYDLILLDLLLPDTDGYEICKKVKSWEVYDEIPITMISSIDNHEEKINALNLGIEDFISKPIHEKEFLIKVNRQITKRFTLEQTRLEKRELNCLGNILNLNYSDLTLEDILENITLEVTRLIGSDRSSIFLKKGKYLISKPAQGVEKNPIIIPTDKGIVGKVARTGIEHISNQVEADPDFHKTTDIKTGYKTTRMITYPIFHEYKVIGVIQTLNKATEYTAHDVSMLKKVSMYTANILARYYAEKQIKRSERFYRKLLDRLYNGVFIVDENDKIIYINQAFTDIFGYTKKEIIGKSKRVLFVPSDMIYLDELGVNIQNIETHLLNKNYDLCPVKLSTKYFELEEGVSGVIYNVSDLRTSLELERKELELDRIRTEFNSMVIHDLKNPLTTIIGFADILKQQIIGDLNTKQLDFIERIDHSSQQMLTLTTEMLEFSKLESGNIPLQIQDVDLRKVIQSVIEGQTLFFKKKNISYIEEDIHVPYLEGDHEKLYRLFTNLVSNAIKFTPIDGKLFIGYDVRGSMITVEIRDTGVGIPAEDIPYIFHKYKQSKHTNNEEGGTGLGLAICKQITEAHHGEIEVKSKLNEGTSFFVTLPVKFYEKSRSIQKSTKQTIA